MVKITEHNPLKMMPYHFGDPSEVCDDAHKMARSPEHEDRLIKLLRGFPKRTERIPLDEYLSQYTHPRFTEGQSTTTFKIVRNTGFQRSTAFYEIYQDTFYGLVLLNGDNTALASISFEPVDGGLLVPQLQWVNNKERQKSLAPIRWKFALLGLVEGFAAAHDIPEVFVLPSSRNLYDQISKNLRGRIIYDKTAERSGFSYDPEREVFAKSPIVPAGFPEQLIEN